MGTGSSPPDTIRLASWPVVHQSDRFSAASKAVDLATQCGASKQAAWEIGTAVAELVSNAVKHGGGGTITIDLETTPRLAFHVTVRDAGDGFPATVPTPTPERWTFRSAGQGLGVGLEGVRRLMDEVTIDSRPGEGATVVAVKVLRVRE